MKKRMLSLLLSITMGILLLTGCQGDSGASDAGADAPVENQDAAGGEEEKPETPDDSAAADASNDEKKKVTGLFLSLEGEYFSLLDTLLRQGLEEKGYAYESQSCNMDPVTMIEQVENAVANGTDMIWIWSPSGEALHDACKAAKDQGVLVYAFVMDVGEDACDVIRGNDPVTGGETIAELASEWADKNWTEDRPIRTILYGNTDTSNLKQVYDAMASKVKEDARFEILEECTFEVSVATAQSYTENMFSKHGEIDCIIASGGEQALGACAYTHSENSPVASDPTKVAVFGTEITEETAFYMKDGSIKGLAVNGGIITENIAVQVEEMDTLLQGGTVEHFSKVDTGKCTLENIADYGF